MRRSVRAALTRGELLIPIVKGWCTEQATQLASLAMQVHGGMGFIEETGVAQTLRDVRITSIYEGTTGIQANDLLGRKLGRDRGAAMAALLRDMLRELNDCAAAMPTMRSVRNATHRSHHGAARCHRGAAAAVGAGRRRAPMRCRCPT